MLVAMLGVSMPSLYCGRAAAVFPGAEADAGDGRKPVSHYRLGHRDEQAAAVLCAGLRHAGHCVAPDAHQHAGRAQSGLYQDGQGQGPVAAKNYLEAMRCATPLCRLSRCWARRLPPSSPVPWWWRKFSPFPAWASFFVTSITNNDYTMIAGTTIFYGVFLVAANLIVDVLYCVIDPRVKPGRRKGGLRTNE